MVLNVTTPQNDHILLKKEPLHAAISSHHLSTVKLLISLGANVNGKNEVLSVCV
jgi:hypothetical protein